MNNKEIDNAIPKSYITYKIGLLFESQRGLPDTLSGNIGQGIGQSLRLRSPICERRGKDISMT